MQISARDRCSVRAMLDLAIDLMNHYDVFNSMEKMRQLSDSATIDDLAERHFVMESGTTTQ